MVIVLFAISLMENMKKKRNKKKFMSALSDRKL